MAMESQFSMSLGVASPSSAITSRRPLYLAFLQFNERKWIDQGRPVGDIKSDPRSKLAGSPSSTRRNLISPARRLTPGGGGW